VPGRWARVPGRWARVPGRWTRVPSKKKKRVVAKKGCSVGAGL